VKIQLAGTKLHFVEDAVVNVRLQDTYWGIFRQSRLWSEWNVALYTRYRDPVNATFDFWGDYAHAWWRVASSLLEVRDRGSLGRWVADLGWQVGRLRGRMQYRDTSE
jgi:hypothetical protein